MFNAHIAVDTEMVSEREMPAPLRAPELEQRTGSFAERGQRFRVERFDVPLPDAAARGERVCAACPPR